MRESDNSDKENSGSSVREKRLRLGAKFVSSIIHAFFSRAEFPVYNNRKSMVWRMQFILLESTIENSGSETPSEVLLKLLLLTWKK